MMTMFSNDSLVNLMSYVIVLFVLLLCEAASLNDDQEVLNTEIIAYTMYSSLNSLFLHFFVRQKGLMFL